MHLGLDRFSPIRYCVGFWITHTEGKGPMTVTVIRLDKREGEGFTQYCIVNTEMNMREFKAYCQIYNVFPNADGLRAGLDFPAHVIRDSSWSTEAGAIKQFERWQTADDVYTTDNPTID